MAQISSYLAIMTELMQLFISRKMERSRALAALPVGEKLRMLEEMVAPAKIIGATRPVRPVNPVRGTASYIEDWYLLRHPFPTEGGQLNLDQLAAQVEREAQ